MIHSPFLSLSVSSRQEYYLLRWVIYNYTGKGYVITSLGTSKEFFYVYIAQIYKVILANMFSMLFVFGFFILVLSAKPF